MLENLKSYWLKKFGVAAEAPPQNTGSNRTLSSYGSTPNSLQRDFGRLYELLRIAMDFFTSGQRAEALPFIEQILSAQVAEPVARLTAACLAAETYRGMGKFDRAEHYYDLSIAESEKLSPEQQMGNEFVRHYRPRAHLGLLTVYRRILHEDHQRVETLLKQVQRDFTRFNVADLQAQVYLVEGLYLRQTGELDNAVDRIKEGYEEIKDLAPPFLFLHPEHFEALLVLTHLCQVDGGIHTLRLANKINKGGRGSWSVAVAAICLLHLHYRRMVDGQFSDFSSNEFGRDHEKVADLMNKLVKNARFERDPFLLSESNMLECIWKMLIEAPTPEVLKEIDEILLAIKDANEPLVLLRAVELAALRQEFQMCGALDHVNQSGIFARGLNLLDQLKPALITYGCDEAFFKDIRQYLENDRPSPTPILEKWNSEALQLLRSKVWP